jgi:uncharacterized protein (DUF952 family)
MSDQIAYKVLLASELRQMQRDGEFRGSPADTADDLALAAVDLSRLGDTVRWEASRDGQLFPHIYGLLPVEAVVSVAPLERTPHGTVKLPV